MRVVGEQLILCVGKHALAPCNHSLGNGIRLLREQRVARVLNCRSGDAAAELTAQLSPARPWHDSAHGVIAAVEAGRGVAVIYQVMAKTASECVVLRPLKPRPQPSPIVLVYREEAVSLLTEMFLNAARYSRLRSTA